MKVAVFVYCLRGGGAERVTAYLANGLAEAGEDVTLVTELDESSDQYAIDARVRRSIIGTGGQGSNAIDKTVNLFRKALRLRKLIRENGIEVIVAIMTRSNNLALLATLGLPCKVVICERNDPRFNPELTGDPLLRKLLYPRADLAVAQTEVMRKVIDDEFKVARSVVIPNPVAELTPPDPAMQLALPERDFILAVGRLVPQKGHDILIRAFAASGASRTLDLVIAGQGGLLGELRALAEQEGVADRVHFLGYVENALPLYQRCHMFVLASRYEGFPNVLLEAMSQGRPVISTRFPSGAYDMIEDGRSGLLIPTEDVAALAGAIDRLASDREAADAMAVRAREAVDVYRLPVVMDRWRAMLKDVVEPAA